MIYDIPEEGWEEKTYYRIQISNFPGNPYHDSILYVGFLNKDSSPGSYSGIMSHNEDYYWRDFHRLGKSTSIKEPVKLFTEDKGSKFRYE